MTVPPGSAVYLFTDLVGSTRLWEQHPDEMREALARHDEIMRKAFERNGGEVFSMAGDSFGAAFTSAPAAVTAAGEIQRELASETWPAPVEIRPRMGVHLGPSSRRAGNFFGSDVNRAARLMSIAHGGQLVVSDAVRAELDGGVELIDLGEHLLKDLTAPEHVFEVDLGLWSEPFPPLRSLDRARVRLPIQPSALLGRDDDAVAVVERFDTTRLLTIRGLGGIGKTRLSIAVAAELAERHPDGVHFVELSRVNDADAVAYAVTDAVGIRVPSGVSPTAAAIGELAGQRRLLVLDNCEHVIGAVRAFVTEILRGCEHVAVLATSRIALNIAGEVIYGLDPLHADSTDSSAVALFVERARAVNSQLTVEGERLGVVADLCARLDGVPLAIELAAARCRSMTPEEVASLLDDRFALLRARDGEAVRHRSLLKTLEWSYEHLDETAQLLLRRLSIFAGPATSDAVHAVCGGDDLDRFDIVDALEVLVDNSLLVADVRGASTRYRMLETIREFGASLLGDDAAPLRERHARFVAAAVSDATWGTLGRDEGIARRELTALWDDLRAAFSYARLVGDVELAASLVRDLAFEVLWRQRIEASAWADGVREMAGFAGLPDATRTGVLATAACGKLFDEAAPEAKRIAAEIDRLLNLVDPADFTPGVVAGTSVFFFLADLAGGLGANLRLLDRYGDAFDKFREMAHSSNSSMYGYAGDRDAALASARSALAVDDPDVAPSWRLLAEWGVLRFGDTPPDDQIGELDSIIAGLLEVENEFLAAAARRYQVALGQERKASLRSIAEELRQVDLADERYATGWMLTAAADLLTVGDDESTRVAIELLGWQDAHRVAPIQPALRSRLFVRLPMAEARLGPEVVAELRARGAARDLASAAELAADAAERAAELSVNADGQLVPGSS